MILTEDKARERWCPMSDYSPSNGEDIPAFARCIASRCIAWRWAKSEELALEDDGEPIGFERKIIGGYCGLAGKPAEGE